MAFTSTDLVLIGQGPNGNQIYYHDAGSDSSATVAASGYYNNTDDSVNLTADDMILADCTDLQMWLKVASVSSGSVTTVPISPDGPNQGDVSTANATLTFGIAELGTGTGTTMTLPTPVPGGYVTVFETGTGTTKVIAVSSAGVTLNAKGDTSILVGGAAGTFVTLRAVSTTQWICVAQQGITLS